MTRSDKLRKQFSDNEAVYISSYPNIFYYSGFTSEDARLLITNERQILFTDSRYTIQAHIESPDFEVFDIYSEMDKVISSIKEEVILFEEDHVTVNEFNKISKYKKETRVFSDKIRDARKIKDEKEIRAIREAQRLTDEGFSYILDVIKPGKSEKEIAMELEFFMRRKGADSLSFETVCASGERSAMPHGTASEKIIKKGEFLTLDFGCMVDGYCSDMTRTVLVGSCGEREKEIYDVVLLAQKAALDLIGPGVKCSDVDKAARDIIEAAGYGESFGHATGHGVGIQIHELPNLSKRSDYILKEGNIVTVEPGIYIEGFGGVRTEDLVQITDQNMINLTKSAKDLLII